MKISMLRSMLWCAALLLLFFLIDGALFFSTRGIIEHNHETRQTAIAAAQAAATQVLPHAPWADKAIKLGETVFSDSSAAYYRLEKNNAAAGYAIHGFGKGFQSVLHVLVVTDQDLYCRNVVVLAQAETPGLGGRVFSQEYLSQFSGKRLSQLKIRSSPEQEGVDAIASSTITCWALVDSAMYRAVAFLKDSVLKNGP